MQRAICEISISNRLSIFFFPPPPFFFLKKKLKNSPTQAQALVAMGLQYKEVEAVSKEMTVPTNQILGTPLPIITAPPAIQNLADRKP